MGRRKRAQDDYDDSLEQSFHAKRSKSEGESTPDLDQEGKETNSSGEKASKERIDRLREQKRLKKLRQKEKKLAAQKEQERVKALREKERQEKEKRKRELKKRKELEKTRLESQDAFVKTAMGVEYKDLLVGKGPEIVDRKRVVCSYVLRAKHKTGKVLDSGDRFAFRIGKGEVIQGWDIGLKGMRKGGRRHIIVPPKAGYGNKDIGGGKGATLYFDVTLLQC